MTLLQRGGPSSIRYFTIAWRDANATASIVASGFNGRIAPEDALRLARKQARRISAAGG